jgi:hypothetical protein
MAAQRAAGARRDSQSQAPGYELVGSSRRQAPRQGPSRCAGGSTPAAAAGGHLGTGCCRCDGPAAGRGEERRAQPLPRPGRHVGRGSAAPLVHRRLPAPHALGGRGRDCYGSNSRSAQPPARSWQAGGRPCGIPPVPRCPPRPLPGMIIYEHLSVPSRFFQWRGTVIASTVRQVCCVLCVTAIWMFTIKVENSHLAGWQVSWAYSEPIDTLAWQLLMFPLGFLLSLRTNQAYGRYLEGVEYYTELVAAAADLCRQSCSYIKNKDGKYDNPMAGVDPAKGRATCDDVDKETIFRHVFAFMAAVRQDIRNVRLECSQTFDELLQLRMHLTTTELE